MNDNPKKPRSPRTAHAVPTTRAGNTRKTADSISTSTPTTALPSDAKKARISPPQPSRQRKSDPVRKLDNISAKQRFFEVRLPTHINWAKLRERGRQYALLARLDKPIGAALLLWPSWWALWLAAEDFPPFSKLFIFTLGVFLMRSAGCVINDYADRWLDPAVKRTKDRPIAAGRVAPREALAVFFVLITLAFLLVLFTNTFTVQLSLIGVALAASYPFMKRYTYLPQVYLGAAFGWCIPMAFAAVTSKLPPLCWLLFLANVVWATIYDTEYAMVDRDDDIRMGAKSTAILFGDADRIILGVLMATFLFAMLLVGSRAKLYWPYFLSLSVVAALFIYQQWLLRAREREAYFQAFRNNNWVGLVVFTGIALTYAIK